MWDMPQGLHQARASACKKLYFNKFGSNMLTVDRDMKGAVSITFHRVSIMHADFVFSQT
jgi:hypothetical protein